MIKVINKDNLPTSSIEDFEPLQGSLKTLSDENYDKLKKSIEKYGFFVPIFVWNGYIMDGHGRREVIIGEGWDIKVPYINIEAEDVEEAKDKLLHITSQYNTITIEGLEEFRPEWEQLGVKFDAITVSKLEPKLEAKEDDFDTTPPEQPQTVLGDLYEIGEHRLLCGDSTDTNQVEKLMNGEKADMVFTDPPYGIDLNTDLSNIKTEKNGWKGKGGKYPKIIGDDKDYDPSHIFIQFSECDNIFLWGADYYADLIPNRNEGCFFVWDKVQNENGKGISWNLGSMFELCWSKKKYKREIIRKLWAGLYGTETQDIRNRIHPTQKPIELCTWFLNKEDSKLIIDLFLGSGSTMVASHQLDRKCYGMELDPKYCDVIVTRMLKLDPSLTIKRNGEVIEWQTK